MICAEQKLLSMIIEELNDSADDTRFWFYASNSTQIILKVVFVIEQNKVIAIYIDW